MLGSLLVRQERLRQLSHFRPSVQALTRRVRSSWPVLVILLLPVLLLSPSLFGGHAVTSGDILTLFPPWSVDLGPGKTSPKNVLLSDEVFQLSPWLLFTRHELAAGRFPFWDSSVAGGTPFFAADQPALLYPPVWLEWVLPYPLGTAVVTLLYWWLAGLGMYVFARASLKLHPVGALIASLSFMFSSFIVVWLIDTIGRPVILFPWLLWASERAIRAPSPQRIIVLALFSALIGLAGHPEMVFNLAFGASLYALWLTWTLPDQRWLIRLRRLLYWGGGITLGMGLAAVQLLPTLALLPQSLTMAARSAHSVSTYLPLSGLATWMVPNVWGNPALIYKFWGPENYNEAVFYAGAVALVLAAVALPALRRREVWRDRAFFVLLVFCILLLLYGIPPFSWATRLPVISTDKWLRFNLFAVLGIAVLAGYGVEDILCWTRTGASSRKEGAVPQEARRRSRSIFQRQRLLLVAGLVGALVTALWSVQQFYHPADYTKTQRTWVVFWVEIAVILVWATCCVLALRWQGWLSRRVVVGVLLVLMLCDQLLFAVPYVPQPLASLAYPETTTIARLQQTVGSARMTAAGWILPPDSNLPYQLHDLRAYENVASSRYLHFMLVTDPSLSQLQQYCCLALVCPSLTLLSVASVAYYATLPEMDANRCAPLAPGQSLTPGPLIPLWTQGGITLWQNTQARPRFYFADSVIPSTGEQQTLAALPTLSAVGRDAILEGVSQASQAPVGQGAITVATDVPGEITLRAQTAAPRWLIVDEGYDPGWQAQVDGIQQTIHPANEMFQAVMVPAGTHTIHLIYRPLSFISGVVLSSLALLILLGLLLGDWLLRKRRRIPPPQPESSVQEKRSQESPDARQRA